MKCKINASIYKHLTFELEYASTKKIEIETEKWTEEKKKCIEVLYLIVGVNSSIKQILIKGSKLL